MGEEIEETDGLDLGASKLQGVLHPTMRVKAAYIGLAGLFGILLITITVLEDIQAAWEEVAFSGLPETGILEPLPQGTYEVSSLIQGVVQDPSFFEDWTNVTWIVCLVREINGTAGVMIESQFHHVTKDNESGGSGGTAHIEEWINSTCFHTVPRHPNASSPTNVPLLYYYQASVYENNRFILSPLYMRWLTKTEVMEFTESLNGKKQIKLRQEKDSTLHAILPNGYKGKIANILILSYNAEGCSVRSMGHAIEGRHAYFDPNDLGIRGWRVYLFPSLEEGLSLVSRPSAKVILITIGTKNGELLASNPLLIQPPA